MKLLLILVYLRRKHQNVQMRDRKVLTRKSQERGGVGKYNC